MTEEDAEEALEAELMPSNQLAVVIKEAGVDNQLAEEFKINFEEHFKMAATWAKKAKNIIVTNENQKVEMQEARTARLFLREKRLEIEQFRVARKKYFLDGGRAIDKIANFLKNTIEPIETYLDSQEHFVELRKKKEDERILAEAHAKLESERIAKEEEDRKERVRLQAENEKLQKKIAEERAEAERKAKAIRDAHEAEQSKLRKEQEAKLAEERARTIEAQKALQKKQIEEANIERERLRKEEQLKQAGDAGKLLKLKMDIQAIKIPEVESNEYRRILGDIKSHLWLCVLAIKIEEEI